MQNSSLEQWLASSHLSGGNAAYIEELYETYLDDPDVISSEWRKIFDKLPKVNGAMKEHQHSRIKEHYKALARIPARFRLMPDESRNGDAKQVKVLQLINAYRFRGHQHANLDPLGLWAQERVKDLDPAFHGLVGEDFEQEFETGSFAIGDGKYKLVDIYDALKKTYCGSVGAEYMHLTDTDEKRWIQARLESIQSQPNFSHDEKVTFLEELTAAEGLEKYLGAKFPGAKRFSLEGGDALIPMLKELVRHFGTHGGKEVVVGMAHRGRLNVLVNVLGKKPSDLFGEFAGKHGTSLGSGDVKYHMGFSCDFASPGGNVHLALAFNPSHLEIVNPVVMGSIRARQERHNYGDGSRALPITIHGDSAIAGQGVVQETFNLSQTRAYKTGGTVRIVVNNQVGFTTSNHEDTRSTQYCTDIAKMVQAPIFHVNADDVESVILVSQIALDFRNTFNRDVVIDLICYRRHGHNEADEPNATQPLMYQKIKKHPTPRVRYAEKLMAEGALLEKEVDSINDEYREALDHGDCVVKEWLPIRKSVVDWSTFIGQDWDAPYQSGYRQVRLAELGQKIATYPESIVPHSRVKKIYDDRMLMAKGEKSIDWGFAENLAYATLLDEGYRLRLTGQDCGRGTFFHRHAVIHSQTDAQTYTPLCNISDKQGACNIWDSVLSEEAVLAFEYGYATAFPAGLTIWEAQFGDFANGAQVVIDQFLSSGEQKWGRLCGLTLLLPHGYEGQGPEHSSARLERFLQLCADHNMQVCVPSTPAQVFHMLRRQILRPMRRPLIVMSPKSLLRLPECVSSLEELAEGEFKNIIGEVDELDTARVERVVLCSGKVYYDLVDARRKHEIDNIAIVRIEQLYPFPMEEAKTLFEQYAHVNEWVWCQEEPQNQGAWYSSQHNFWAAIPAGAQLSYAGRAPSASPAAGYMSLHVKQQQALVRDALNIEE